MMILERIVEQTIADLKKRKQKIKLSDFRSFDEYERPIRDFAGALKGDEVRIIAEIKKASPSKGIIIEKFDPLKIAEAFQNGGAAAISVLTDEPFFQGSLDILRKVSKMVTLPVLRKDFIVDDYQVQEAKAYGADAILLIASILSYNQLYEIHHAATEAGLQCLVECYDENDFLKINFKHIRILGVNNRDLNTFKVDVHRGIELLTRIPDHIIKVSESGLTTKSDIDLLRKYRINAALIGEHFMRQNDIKSELSKLINK